MIPTRLNVLSPQKRQHLKRLTIMQTFKTVLELLLFVVAIIGVFLRGASWVLERYIADVHVASTGQAAAESEATERIRTANKEIRALAGAIGSYVPWADQMRLLADAIPAGVVLNALVDDEKNGEYAFSGTAATRADLLQLQTNLEALEHIDRVIVPLSQLTERENISFSITATREKD